jgi:hypothetical protein
VAQKKAGPGAVQKTAHNLTHNITCKRSVFGKQERLQELLSN